jgi:hypothetical protein
MVGGFKRAWNIPGVSPTTFLGTLPDAEAKIWIYVNKPDRIAAPTPEIPIVQSYVDLFMVGCLDLQKKVVAAGVDFPALCVTTTDGWSEHWATIGSTRDGRSRSSPAPSTSTGC